MYTYAPFFACSLFAPASISIDSHSVCESPSFPAFLLSSRRLYSFCENLSIFMIFQLGGYELILGVRDKRLSSEATEPTSPRGYAEKQLIVFHQYTTGVPQLLHTAVEYLVELSVKACTLLGSDERTTFIVSFGRMKTPFWKVHPILPVVAT